MHNRGTIDSMFIEESGKTKSVELVNVAQTSILTRLVTGELLELRIKRLKVFVLDTNNIYIGMLPDDIGKRLIKFIKGGNTYEACVKSANEHHVIIFIKELKRASRFKNYPSFLQTIGSDLTLSKSKTQNKNEKAEEDYAADGLES